MVGVSRRPVILCYRYEAGSNAQVDLYALGTYRRTRHRQRGRGLHAVRKGVVEHTTRLAQDDRQGFVDAIGRSDRAIDTLTRHGSERGTVRRHGLPV